MNKLELEATEKRHQVIKDLEAERQTWQKTVDERDRAQETCWECGEPTERRRVVTAVNDDCPETDVESVCTNPACG